MARYILLGLILGFACPGASQHLSLFDIDGTSYPTVSGKFYAIDSQGNQLVTLTPADLVIKENGRPQEIIRVVNPTYSEPEPLSIVLTADISSSMTGRNVNIAKEALRALVETIKLDPSECAITSFDNYAYVLSDFSYDKKKLLSQISQLHASGGTSYEQAFNNPLSGALEIARRGSHKKVIIFLTDGLGTADPERVIREANSLGASIYCIAVGLRAPEVLKEISVGTEGAYFENVNTPDQAKQAYLGILRKEQGLKPSTVEWLSSPDCQYSKLVSFEWPAQGLVNNGSIYRVTENYRGVLGARPNFVQFRNVRYGQPNYSIITLEAANLDFTIDSIRSDHEAFEVVDVDLPLAVRAGQPIEITLQYVPTSRQREEARITFMNNKCTPLVVYASNDLNSNQDVSLRVEQPNGGEIFYVGADTVITWSGTLASENVKLEFSYDNGTTWDSVAHNSSNFQEDWHIPNVIGDQMLIRASRNFESKKSEVELIYEKDFPGHDFQMSLDNTRILSRYHKMYVHNLKTGDLMDTLTFTEPGTPYIMFGGGGSRIYSNFNGQIKVYDVNGLKLIGQAPAIGQVSAFSEDGSRYLLQEGERVQIVELESGIVLREMTIPVGEAETFRDDLVAIIRGRGMCEVWNIDRGSLVATFDTNSSLVRDATITRDQKFLITTSSMGGGPRIVNVFEIESGRELYSLPDFPYGALGRNRIGANFLIYEKEDSAQVIDIPTGEIVAELPVSARYLHISKDGKYLMSRSNIPGTHWTRAGHIKIFRFDPHSYAGSQGNDVSDSTFSIVAPKLRGQSVAFGKIILGELREQFFKVVENPFPVSVRVDTAYLEGSDAEAFSIVSLPPNVSDLSWGELEFRFKPTRVGLHNANVIMRTPFETMSLPISGEGAMPTIAWIDQTINLGKVTVGEIKDSLVSNVIHNVGPSQITITSVELAGPDRDQFQVPSETDFRIKKNRAHDQRIAFSPSIPGRTSTRISYHVEGIPDLNYVLVFAEGVGTDTTTHSLPATKPDLLRTIEVQVRDRQTRDLLQSRLKLSLSSVPMESIGGDFSFSASYGDSIRMVAESDGYLPEVFTLLPDPNQSKPIVIHEFLLTRVGGGELITLENVLFVQSKPELLPESHEQLEMLRLYLVSHPGVHIELAGHTDNQGNPRLNQKLSEDRVGTIIAHLIQSGIEKSRLSGNGYGDTRPIASNETEETRRLNRRVEFRVVKE